jgi:hypothetical protein
MSKYSYKIKSIIKNINPDIKIDARLQNSPTIRSIYDNVSKSLNMTHTIKLADTRIIRSIHKKKEYPLNYIFFRNLREVGILDKLVKYSPDFSNFHNFVEWHRKHIPFIDFDQMHRLIERSETSDGDADNFMDIYRTIFRTTGTRKILHDALYCNPFVSLDVQHDIETSDLVYKKYTIDGLHQIDVFVPIGDQLPNMNLIASIIGCMELMAGHKIKVNLTVIFSRQKKKVTENTKFLSCDNINSGSTYPKHSIVCWRREEFYKVLIHELFHYHMFDFHNTDLYYDELERMIHIPKIIGIDMLNEAYTESMAIIINTMFFSVICLENGVIKNNGNRQYDQVFVLFTKVLKDEIAFIMFQIAKVLSIFGCTNFNSFLNGECVIEQYTSFRSYFIIKLMLLSNINSLIEMIDRGGFAINKHRLLEFGKLINSSHDMLVSNMTNVNQINNLIIRSRQYDHTEKQKWIHLTCRMSATDLF